MPQMLAIRAGNIRLVPHSPAFTEFCEGCGKTKEGVTDIELQSHTGRQIARTFLCQPCIEEACDLLMIRLSPKIVYVKHKEKE